MYQANGYNVYKNNSVNYASKDQLLLMLVDGAVKFSKMARQAMVDKDIKKCHELLTRTQDIFTELMITMDRGAGEWAESMFRIYEFINYQLMQANIKKDLKIMDDTIVLIQEVRDTWYEADRVAKGAR